MESSDILSRIIGPVLLIVGVGVLLNLKECRQIVNDYERNPALRYIGGFFALIVGLIILEAHPVYRWGWEVLITIIGWIAAIKGTFLIVTPSLFSKLTSMYKKSLTPLIASAIIDIVLGIFLIIKGYL